jgi:trehalose/maltose hydrolase-like predicted phosphorylase
VYRNASEVVVGTQDQIYSRRGLINRTVLTAAEIGDQIVIILETGRFWFSRAQLEADGHRHIRGVIGPDEYHEHIDDNAFTNIMARWNIRRALEVATLLRERWPECWARLSGRLGLDDAELKQWLSAADTMATGLDPKTGLFEQFAGFFALEDVDLTHYAGRSVPMDVVLGRERTQRSQVVKQADVVRCWGCCRRSSLVRRGRRTSITTSLAAVTAAR